MMKLRFFHLVALWMRSLFSTKALSSILGSFGALWLIVETTSFFLANTPIPDKIRQSWLLFAVVGMLIAGYRCRPRHSVSCNINNRDTMIEIAIGNLFSFRGDLIIGTNTTFDTRVSRELISDRSVQGAFTRKYYLDETQLDAEISSALSTLKPQRLKGPRIGKLDKYPMGTCVRVSPKQRIAYLVAIADINEGGSAVTCFDDLKQCLPKIWLYIAQRGVKGVLVMPVLGTGFGRLPQTREEVVREIIKSFVAACSESTFADKLTIVITPHDLLKYRISLEDLGDFLRHECKYAIQSSGNRQATGTPV